VTTRIGGETEFRHAALKSVSNLYLAEALVEQRANVFDPLFGLARRTRRECFTRSKGAHEFTCQGICTVPELLSPGFRCGTDGRDSAEC
jgi:hypothetical protein